jgi:hypothetical protein
MSSIKTSKIVPLSSALTIDSTTTAVVGKLCAGGTAGDTPITPLQVYGASSSQGAANRGVFLASNTTNSRQVQIGINDASQYGWIEGWVPGFGGLTMCINPTGAYVGIGTTTPAVALDINGQARSSTSTTSASNDKTLTTKDYVDTQVEWYNNAWTSTNPPIGTIIIASVQYTFNSNVQNSGSNAIGAIAATTTNLSVGGNRYVAGATPTGYSAVSGTWKVVCYMDDDGGGQDHAWVMLVRIS